VSADLPARESLEVFFGDALWLEDLFQKPLVRLQLKSTGFRITEHIRDPFHHGLVADLDAGFVDLFEEHQFLLNPRVRIEHLPAGLVFLRPAPGIHPRFQPGILVGLKQFLAA
jgi:hypothetical protein